MSQIEGLIKDLFKDHKRVGAGEWAGPCPRCGGVDRCRVFEGQGNQKLFRAWCRQCGMIEDALAIVQELRYVSFAQAHTYLGLRVPEHLAAKAGLSELERQRKPTPEEVEAELMARCQDLAWSMTPDQILGILGGQEPRGQPMMYRAVLHTLMSRMAAMELMMAMMYMKDRKKFERLGDEIRDRGFPWWSFDALGIDQRTLDELAGSDPWAPGVKGK